MAKKPAPHDGATSRAVIVSPTLVEPVPRQSSAFQNALGVAGRAAAGGAAAAAATASGMGGGIARGARDAGRMAGSVGQAVAEAGGKVAMAVGDLNGDGKVDEADFRIARDTAGRAATVAAREAGDLGKAVMRHEITKDAAAGAAVGALIAVPIPFVGPAAGAAVGAAIGLTRGVVGAGMIGDVVGQVADGLRKPPRRKTSPRKKKPAS